MQTVQITALDAMGRVVMFTLGMGRTIAAARAAAKTGMTARLHRERVKAGMVRKFVSEAI